MRIHRFYTKLIIDNRTQFVLDDEMLVHQMLHVFRYKIGQKVILFDGTGFDYLAEIVETNKESIIFLITEKKSGLVQTQTFGKEVALCFSLVKKDNVDLILQKATEIGVTTFYPLISDRSEKKEFNEERGLKILVESAEQSGWSVIPVLHPTMTLEMVIRQTKESAQIFCSTVSSVSNKVGNENTALFIGPEGGWTERELALFKENVFESCSLGKQVLRTETAAIVACGRFLESF